MVLTGSSPAFARHAALVAVWGALIGALTSFGQGFLPFELSPLANSAGSWSLAAFLLAMVEVSPRRSAVLGAVALATMLVGYAVATQLRGFSVGAGLVGFWGVASIVAGPALGAGAAWVRGSDAIRIAAGVALIAGILVGEGVYGLTVVADTTPAGYWVGEMILGLGIMVFAAMRRLRSLRHLAIGIVLTAIVAAAFYATYSGNLIELF